MPVPIPSERNVYNKMKNGRIRFVRVAKALIEVVKKAHPSKKNEINARFQKELEKFELALVKKSSRNLRNEQLRIAREQSMPVVPVVPNTRLPNNLALEYHGLVIEGPSRRIILNHMDPRKVSGKGTRRGRNYTAAEKQAISKALNYNTSRRQMVKNQRIRNGLPVNQKHEEALILRRILARQFRTGAAIPSTYKIYLYPREMKTNPRTGAQYKGYNPNLTRPWLFNMTSIIF